MNAASEDIKDLLVAEGSSLGLVFQTTLFIGKEPSSPNDTVTIYDTPGMPPDLSFDRTEIYNRSSFQIRVRNEEYDTGMDLARDIFDLLHGRAQETVNGTLYTVIRAVGEPALLDWDANDRPRFIINFDCQRR